MMSPLLVIHFNDQHSAIAISAAFMIEEGFLFQCWFESEQGFW